jgi:hypothetical protein
LLFIFKLLFDSAMTSPANDYFGFGQNRGHFSESSHLNATFLEPVQTKRAARPFDFAAESPEACAKRQKQEFLGPRWDDDVPTFDPNTPAEFRGVLMQAPTRRLQLDAVSAAELDPQQPNPRSASGYYGVYANKKRWAAQIYYDGKKHCLGTFDTKQEAALAYDREERSYACKTRDKLLNYESIEAAEGGGSSASTN